MKFFHVPTFILFLALGLFFVYISSPSPDIIYIYPTPDNINKLQYQDKGGTCHSFAAKEIECPKDKKKIENYPIN